MSSDLRLSSISVFVILIIFILIFDLAGSGSLA